jgi:cellulose synthase/poly-beta-1,6-N-acetylglucosamine synthase-like glycosyltransferase
VLDEGGDPAVEALCRDVGARYFSRRGVERYQAASGRFQRRTKHGNYNAWLDHAGYAAYDVIAIFDPDHVPVRHYLTRLLGYLRDPGVAYVQSPQLYYNQAASFIARGAAEETYAYYSSVQMAGYAAGFPVSIGCHTVHRSTALREVGGLPSHDADDLAVTLLYLAAGWRGVYDPCPLAEGLAPVDWQGYLTQQRRWARSVLDLKLRLYPRLVRSLPWRLRLAAGLHGLYYLSGVVFPLLIILICFVLATSHHSTLAHRSAYLPMLALYTCLLTCDLYRQRFFVRRDREFGLHWRAAVLRFAKWPWLLAAFVDVLRPRRTRRLGYQITAKRAQPAPRFLMAPHAVAACAVVAAWVAGRLDGRHPSLVAEIGAAAVLSASLAVLASSVRPFPPPYDPVLAPVAT